MPSLQTYNLQRPSSHFAPPTSKATSSHSILPSPGNTARSSTGRDFAAHTIGRIDSVSTPYCQWSPVTDGLFSHADSRPSTASSSPCSGLSPRTSRASSLTSLPHSDRVNDNVGLVISAAQIERICKTLEELFNPTPTERAPNPKDQHKVDEQRRRAIHKKLYEVHEEISHPVLVRLQDPNSNCYQEGLPSHLVRAMVTGNHKKHSTKTAIHLAQIVQVVHQSERIISLEEELMRVYEILESAGMLIAIPQQFSQLSSRARKP